jgi:hypothetical protein
LPSQKKRQILMDATIEINQLEHQINIGSH